jgi:hypothetical protein
MDFKKLIADLAARYRKLAEPISSSSLSPPGQVVDVDAGHEAGRKAGYEAGYKKGYDEGLQVGLVKHAAGTIGTEIAIGTTIGITTTFAQPLRTTRRCLQHRHSDR